MKLKDSYRWLEDFTSEESKDWVNRQNQYTQQFIGKINIKNL
jgi:prolyl oligopeptidase